MSIRARIDEVIDATPGMTYRKLSLAAGLSDSMMHKFMTNSTQSMSIDKLLTVAEALNVDPRWLIFGETAPPDNVINLWDRIADADKPRAMAILEALATDAK
jgi:transcriptional regulator with XRE-family HTH domain